MLSKSILLDIDCFETLHPWVDSTRKSVEGEKSKTFEALRSEGVA